MLMTDLFKPIIHENEYVFHKETRPLYTKLPVYTITLLQNLESYLDTSLYFYGSIQRNDYIQNNSDIDIDVFAVNKESMALNAYAFLSMSGIVSESKCIYMLQKDSSVVEGIKLNYKHFTKPIQLELSVYSIQDKESMVHYHASKINIPMYISTPLYVLKYAYYKWHIIPKWMFKACKELLINNSAGKNNAQYVTL
tara:strand:- start:308 stop:895 length:588 start_codon:yes stop_codon:yes gene_type:complete